jgi:UDP-N-acetylglucosamine:LPS N-acetylglucosamine transferase
MEPSINNKPASLAKVRAASIARTFQRPAPHAAARAAWPQTASAEVPGRNRACRLLLLTSSLGNGHVRAAAAIEAAVLARAPETTVKTLDFWALMDEKVAWAARTTYLRVVQEHSGLFDRIYQLDQKTWRSILESTDPPPSSFAEVVRLVPSTSMSSIPRSAGGAKHPLDRLLLRLLCFVLAGHPRHSPVNARLLRLALIRSAWERLARRLAEAVSAFAPHAIVATQMNPAALLSSARKRGAHDIPTIGVPTDFGVHDFWVQDGIDRYCLAHESIAKLHRPNIGAERVAVTGIPLMPGFRQPPSMQEARRMLGLGMDVPVVLVAGGGLGMGVDAVAQKLLAASLPVQILAIAARNSEAHRTLATLAAHHAHRLRLWDWTERMELLIRAADVVVGKPGGLTVAEALACGRPLLAARALGGQEGFNVRFLERHGVGKLVPESELIGTLTGLLADRLTLTGMQERAWQLGHRDGADRIAELALEFAAPQLVQEAQAT